MPEITSERTFSPADMARILCGKASLGAAAVHSPEVAEHGPVVEVWNPENVRTPENFAKAGQVFKMNGTWYRWEGQAHRVASPRPGEPMTDCVEPLTYSGFYGHDTTGGMNGAGWDSRFSLADENTAWERHGRTFTWDQIFGASINMPDEQILQAVPLDEASITELGLD